MKKSAYQIISSENKLSFPESRGIMINMMPYIIGDHGSIPPEYLQYIDIIKVCEFNLSKEEMGKIGYLTINESDVKAGETQRRGGAHVERHPNAPWGGGGSWGGEKGGLFMINSVDASCRIWPMQIPQPEQGGNCERFRWMLNQMDHYDMKANELVWMTDSTPHESLPAKENGHRQFFRMVSSDVGIWFEKNSTANRLGVEPPSNVRITRKDKFSGFTNPQVEQLIP